jgi:FtsH-binding integral membrane protein
MSSYDRNSARYSTPVAASPAGAIDEGLRAYMLRVYNYMAFGLALTGVTAFATYSLSFRDAGGRLAPTAFGQTVFGSSLMWVIFLAPLGLVFLLSFGINRMSVGAAQAAFWAYAALLGVSLSVVFAAYTFSSVTEVFFITAAMFAGLSLWGYTTGRDLTQVGSFLFMGLIGIVVASLVGIFWHSSALQFAISIIGVVVFTGLTAYDTQKIKELYFADDDSAVAGRKAILGALSLYLDFLNLFLMLLRLFGDRRD